MDMQLTISQISLFAAKAYICGENAVFWCGHAVKIGYSKFAIPISEKIAAFAMIVFSLLQKLFRSGPGLIFALAGSLLLAGITAFKLADQKTCEDDMLLKTAWKTAGITLFIASTALTSLGIASALSI